MLKLKWTTGWKLKSGAAGAWARGMVGWQSATVMVLVAIVAAMALETPARALDPGAGTADGFPLVSATGDQTNPDIQDGIVVFGDPGPTGEGMVMRVPFGGGTPGQAAGPGLVEGPRLDQGAVSWLRPDWSACMTVPGSGAEDCVALPEPALEIAFSGDKAITSHGGKVIRLVNFGTGRSKILDSSTTTGDRYNPDIAGERAVWVKDRGYAGKYYEPLIVDYDLATDTYIYLTATGGGSTTSGESLFQRANPVLAGDRVVYQQRLRDAGEQWDLYLAEADTYGVQLLSAPGDQVNPAAEGDIVVYQDNRGGHLEADGTWVGEWDIYALDMATGLETPVCTEAGDQINPSVDGNTVVWQDNRGGDWDIYAATISRSENAEPAMSVRVEDVYWRDYEAYLARDLTVDYLFSNHGDGPAASFSLRQVDISPSGVSAPSLPLDVGTIDPAGTEVLSVSYHVPVGISWFKASLFASCMDQAGMELWFPRNPQV